MTNTLTMTRSQLLLIDVQERLFAVMDEPERLTKGCEVLLQGAHMLTIPVTLSEQYPKGLGQTIEALRRHKADASVFEKNHFSCLRDKNLHDHLMGLKNEGRDQIIIGGIETHICVTQTALDCLAAGFETYIVSDATSSRTSHSKTLGEERLRGEGAKIITTEMALFEWLGVADSDMFKTFSGLIK